MNSKFIKNFAIIGSGTFISMAVGFMTTPIITRLVSPDDYGQYSVFTLYANIALMVLYLGLDQSLIRYFYENDSIKYKRALTIKCVVMPVVACFGSVGIISFLIAFHIWEFELGLFALVFLCLYTFVQVIYRFAYLLVRLQYKTKLYSTLGVIQKVTYVIISIALITFGFTSDVNALIIGTTLSILVVTVVSIISQKELWNLKLYSPCDCHISNSELFKYAYPYVFSMGITTLFQTADKLALNLYGSYSDVGIYSSTMTLVHVFSIVQTSFNALWAPMAVERYTKDKEDTTFFIKGNQAITFLMFAMGFSLILCKDIFAILLGEKYRQAAYILPFLIFNPIMYTISETTVNGIVFLKKSKMQVLIASVSCLVNIAGNAILVPVFGCQGAAISTGISYIVFFSLRTFISNRYFPVDFKLKKFYCVTFLAVIYAAYNTFVRFNWISVAGYVVCIGVLMLLYKNVVIELLSYSKGIIQRISAKFGGRN